MLARIFGGKKHETKKKKTSGTKKKKSFENKGIAFNETTKHFPFL